MALISASSDNTFEGAIVFLGDKKLYVYKVNKKTMYVGEKAYKDYLSIKESLPKGYTFVKLMTRIEAKKVSYSLYRVSEEEVSRKESFDKLKTVKKNLRVPMTKRGEAQVDLLFRKRFLTNKGAYRFPSEIDNHRIIVVVFDKDMWSVINVDGTLYIYDLKYNVYVPFKNSVHKDGINVLWPERDYEVSVKSAV